MSALSLHDHMSDAGLDKWLAQVGVTPAPVPRGNVRTALRFFATHMPTLPPAMALNFLRAMDLSRPVSAPLLPVGERLIAFRTGSESPFKLFYTRSGASKYSSGINPAGRSAVHFTVRAPAPALESYTSGVVDVWTVRADDQTLTVAPRANSAGVMVAGGGTQLIVPRAPQVLVVS
jgi:hypothetical protein